MPRPKARRAAPRPHQQQVTVDAPAIGHLVPTLLTAGDTAAAERAARQLVRKHPRLAQAWHWLGLALIAQNHLPQARRALTTAHQLQPRDPVLLVALSGLLLRQRLFQPTMDLLDRNPDIVAGEVDLLINLSAAQSAIGDGEAALATGQRACALAPENPSAWANLGLFFLRQQCLEEAHSALATAVRLDPTLVDAWSRLSLVLCWLGRLSEAETAARTALQLDGSHADARIHLGLALRVPGRAAEARAVLSQTLADAPDRWQLHQSLLITALADASYREEEILALHRRFATDHCPAATPVVVTDRRRDRRLRIAYVSGDFRYHVVATRIMPTLHHHDPAQVEVFGYSNTAVEDAVTDQIRQYCHHWRPTRQLDDREMVAQLRADAIDVVIDLAGHTTDNRLRALAARGAPVQVHWIGYPGTTGVPAIDWRLADPILIPPELDWMYTERVWRLPRTLCCFAPPATTPAITIETGASRGSPVIGCFSQPHKLSPETLATAGAILATNRNARLRLQYAGMADPGIVAITRAQLMAAGATAEQIDCRGHVAFDQFLAELGEIDLILDPYPYNGSTTTLQASWMGVPVVTRRGQRWVSRNGAMVLTALGLEDLITDSQEEQVACVLALLANPERLAALRASLRARMEASVFLDHRGFTVEFEATLRALWHHHLDTHHP